MTLVSEQYTKTGKTVRGCLQPLIKALFRTQYKHGIDFVLSRDLRQTKVFPVKRDCVQVNSHWRGSPTQCSALIGAVIIKVIAVHILHTYSHICDHIIANAYIDTPALQAMISKSVSIVQERRRPWNIIFIMWSNHGIIPFRSWLTKNYIHLTPTYFNINNVCTWVSFCRCSSYRPVWMKHNNARIPLYLHPFLQALMDPIPTTLCYVVSAAMQMAPSGKPCLTRNVPRVVATATDAPSLPQDLIQWQLYCPQLY